jgi:ribulose-phosphate 3-epimerase
MMCVNFADTKADLTALTAANVEYLHFDVMDGSFVPNYAAGICMINGMRNDIPFDIHLMVDKPEVKLHYFDLRPGDAVSVHAETTPHLQRVLTALKSKGVLAGVALNPATPLCVLDYVLDTIDYVLIMTVNPGYSGQTLVEATLPKIKELKELLNQKGRADITIQVDGCVNFENARRIKELGAGNFVSGDGIFRKDMTITEAVNRLRQSIK